MGLFLIFVALFIIVMKVEHRNVLIGIVTVGMLASLFFLAQQVAFKYSQTLDSMLPHAATVSVISKVIMSIVGIVPTIMIFITIWYGLKVIRKEGLESRNSRTLAFAMILIAYTLLWPLLGGVKAGLIYAIIYGFIGNVVVYFILLKSVFTLSSIINLLHRKGGKDLDYLILMGAGLNGDKAEELLDRRVERTKELYILNPGVKIIVTGGWKEDEKVPDPVDIALKLKKQGIPNEDILVDIDSKNTFGDIEGAKVIIGEDDKEAPKVALVTSSYHVLRSLITAKKQKLKCIGYGASVRIDYRMNAFIREYYLYLKTSKKTHIILLSLLLLIYVIFAIFFAVNVENYQDFLFNDPKSQEVIIRK